MSHWIDHLPSHERAKIRARLRSPEEYEKLRERVKGPSDLMREMKMNESLANLKFDLETEPKLKKELKERIQEDIREKGIDAVLGVDMVLEDFDVTIEQNPATNEDQLVVLPEGNVHEKIPITPAFNEQYLGQFS
ncbi:MAG: hypothetical protein WCX61_02350 [Candidatus Peribacteraceae bacterium]|jgi:hypothetical protein